MTALLSARRGLPSGSSRYLNAVTDADLFPHSELRSKWAMNGVGPKYQVARWRGENESNRAHSLPALCNDKAWILAFGW